MAKQNLIKNRIQGYIKPQVNISQNQRQKQYLNYSDINSYNYLEEKYKNYAVRLNDSREDKTNDKFKMILEKQDMCVIKNKKDKY